MREKIVRRAPIYLIVFLLVVGTVSCSALRNRLRVGEAPTNTSAAVTELPGSPVAVEQVEPEEPTERPQLPTATPTFTPLPTNTPVFVVLEPTKTPTRLPATSTPTATAWPTVTPSPTRSQRGAGSNAPAQKPAYYWQDVLTNGDFEEGFGYGGVAQGWHGFHNGSADFVWGDTIWDVAVWEGKHAQLMSVQNPLQGDRYVGIFQTFPVTKGLSYEFAFHGLIQSSAGSAEASKWGNRIQWGVDYNGGTDWQMVNYWTDAGWDEYPLLDGSSIIGDYRITLQATSEAMTIFIRGWKKWAWSGSVANFYLDGIKLKGPKIVEEPSKLPTTGLTPGLFLVAGLLGLLVVAFRQIRRSMA